MYTMYIHFLVITSCILLCVLMLREYTVFVPEYYLILYTHFMPLMYMCVYNDKYSSCKSGVERIHGLCS